MAMFLGSHDRIGLAEYLTELQAELSKARSQTATDDIKFSVDGVTLEVDISYTIAEPAEWTARAKPEFWVLGIAARDSTNDEGSDNRTTQHLVVRLSERPDAADADESADVVATSSLPRAPLPEAREVTTEKPRNRPA